MNRSLTKDLDELVDGRYYAFDHVQQSGNGQWYAWTSAAMFLERQTGRYSDRLILSFRPVAGTSEIPVAHVTAIREATGPIRPKRHKGAVPAPKGVAA